MLLELLGAYVFFFFFCRLISFFIILCTEKVQLCLIEAKLNGKHESLNNKKNQNAKNRKEKKTRRSEKKRITGQKNRDKHLFLKSVIY